MKQLSCTVVITALGVLAGCGKSLELVGPLETPAGTLYYSSYSNKDLWSHNVTQDKPMLVRPDGTIVMPPLESATANSHGAINANAGAAFMAAGLVAAAHELDADRTNVVQKGGGARARSKGVGGSANAKADSASTSNPNVTVDNDTVISPTINNSSTINNRVNTIDGHRPRKTPPPYYPDPS